MGTAAINWPEAVKPLLKKYKKYPHPLNGENAYQYIVMVLLAAQTNDILINNIAPELFKAFPTLESMAGATPEALYPYISKVINYRNKAKWLTAIAAELKEDSKIPLNMDALVKLPGIGRKSANVILREAGKPPAGIMVDLHTIRVAQRLQLATESDGPKMEAHLMQIFPVKQWEIGMALSFHGREICRPKPMCGVCIMRKICPYADSIGAV